MCGLFGIFSTNISNKDEQIFKEGLYTSVFRGTDATGTGSVNGAGLTSFFKMAVPAPDYVRNSDFKRWMNRNHKVLMGHTRSATWAENDRSENAHPFYVAGTEENKKHILLAHNGHITNKWEVGCEKHFPVDSNAIAYGIWKNGIDWAVSKMDGGYALTYWDSSTQTFNMVRNDKRPLFLAKHKNSKTWVYGSEAMMVEWVCTRNGMELEYIRPLKVGVLYSYSLKKHEITERQLELKKDLPIVVSQFPHTGGQRRGKWNVEGECGVSYVGQYGIDEDDIPPVPNHEPVVVNNVGDTQEGSKSNPPVIVDRIVRRPIPVVTTTKGYSIMPMSVDEVFKKCGLRHGEYFEVWLAEFNSDSSDLLKVRGRGEGWPCAIEKDAEVTVVGINLTDYPEKKFQQGTHKVLPLYAEWRKCTTTGVEYAYIMANRAVYIEPLKEAERVAAARAKNLALVKKAESVNNSVVIGPKNKMVSLEEFDKLTSKGCQGGCQGNFYYNDAPDIVWLNDDVPVCANCAWILRNEDTVIDLVKEEKTNVFKQVADKLFNGAAAKDVPHKNVLSLAGHKQKVH